jgi:hypothetical protein
MSLRLLARMLLAIACLPMIVACGFLTQTLGLEEPPSHDPVFVACRSFHLITFDRLADTPVTILQIKQHNAAWSSLCGAETPPKKETELPRIRQQALSGLVPE